MSKWAEIRCNHNNGEGFWCVDAWKTSNDNEEGEVIAVIDETSKNVYYLEPLARTDQYAQEVIKETIATL